MYGWFGKSNMSSDILTIRPNVTTIRQKKPNKHTFKGTDVISLPLHFILIVASCRTYVDLCSSARARTELKVRKQSHVDSNHCFRWPRGRRALTITLSTLSGCDFVMCRTEHWNGCHLHFSHFNACIDKKKMYTKRACVLKPSNPPT